MKKINTSILLIFSLTPYIITMENTDHQIIPTAQAQLISLDDQEHEQSTISVDAHAEIDIFNCLYQNQDVITHDELDSSLNLRQPTKVYNHLSNLVREDFLLDDNSEHTTDYQQDGIIITTVFDSNKIKQHQSTLYPNKKITHKEYDEQGKLTSTQHVETDGSSITTYNSLDGVIIELQRRNNLNRLEENITLDDYGNKTTILYYPNGSEAFHTVDTNNNVMKLGIKSIDDVYYITHFNPSSHEIIYYEQIINFFGAQTHVIFDTNYRLQRVQEFFSHGKKLTQYDHNGNQETTWVDIFNRKTQFEKINTNGSKIYLTYDPESQQILNLSTLFFDPATGNSRITSDNKQDNRHITATLYPDGSGSAVYYNDARQPIFKEILYSNGVMQRFPIN